MSALREMRRRRGLSMEALARLVDTSASQINKLEKGQRRLTDDWLRRLAVALQCNPGDLIDALPSAPRPTLGLDPKEYAFVPVCSLVSMDREGPGAGLGHFLNYAVFRIDWLNSVSAAPPDELVIFAVEDDSMEPTMRSGDHVLAERTDNKMRGDGIYALKMGAGLTIKRIAFSPEGNTVSLRSDNPIYPSHEYVNRSGITLIGRVVWMGRRL